MQKPDFVEVDISTWTDADNKRALAELESLFGSEPGTPAWHRMDVLADLIEMYEMVHHRFPPHYNSTNEQVRTQPTASKFWRTLRSLLGKPQPVITRDEALQIAYRYVAEKERILIRPPEVSEELNAYCVYLMPGATRLDNLYIDFKDGHVIRHDSSP